MTTQTEMFAKTKVDFATEFLNHFQADVESAEKAVTNAKLKLAAAVMLRDDAEENLRRERIAAGVATAEEIAYDMHRTAVEGGYSVTFETSDGHTAHIGADVEPDDCLTDAEAGAAQEAAVFADVDPVTGEVNGGTVTVSGPDLEPFTVTVGSRTRFAALIFAYAEQVGIADVVPGEWEVLGADGLPVDETAVIEPQWYGLRFVVAQVAAVAP